MFKRVLALATLSCFAVLPNIAQSSEEFPTLTLLYHTTEKSALEVSCQKQTNGTLDCSFSQTSVSKNAKPSDLQGKCA